MPRAAASALRPPQLVHLAVLLLQALQPRSSYGSICVEASTEQMLLALESLASHLESTKQEFRPPHLSRQLQHGRLHKADADALKRNLHHQRLAGV